MPLRRPAKAQPADADGLGAGGERRWSWGLLLLLAGVWSFVALAFFLSWLPEADQSEESAASAAVWYGETYFLWFLFSPLVFFLVRRFPIPGQDRVRTASIHVLAAVILAMVHVTIFLPLDHWLDPDFHIRYASLANAFKNNFVYRSLTGTVTYGVVLLAFASDAYLRRARLQEQRAEELRRQLAEAQLQALRMQIQPHFLFNTLHSISSLIYEAPPQALTMVARLGDFLRATLERGALQTVRLEDELSFAQLYLEIEKVRFDDRLRVTIDAAPDVLAAEAPTLVLQPLLENAIRHGVAPATGPVALTIVAASQGDDLEITLRNVELNAAPARGIAPVIEGLGLSNTRARLERAYGDRASLRCEAPAPGTFEVTVRMPMRARNDGEG